MVCVLSGVSGEISRHRRNSEFQNDGAFTDAFALFVELGESSDAQNSSGLSRTGSNDAM